MQEYLLQQRSPCFCDPSGHVRHFNDVISHVAQATQSGVAEGSGQAASAAAVQTERRKLDTNTLLDTLVSFVFNSVLRSTHV